MTASLPRLAIVTQYVDAIVPTGVLDDDLEGVDSDWKSQGGRRFPDRLSIIHAMWNVSIISRVIAHHVRYFTRIRTLAVCNNVKRPQLARIV